MKDEDLGQLNQTPETAGDLTQVEGRGITENQLQQLLHVVEGVVREWMSESRTSSKLSRHLGRPRGPCGSRRTPLPEGFALDAELVLYVADKLPKVDAAGLLETFRLQAGAKRWMYVDWRRAFQMYVRNVAPNSGHWSQGQYPKLAIDWTQPVDVAQIKW